MLRFLKTLYTPIRVIGFCLYLATYSCTAQAISANDSKTTPPKISIPSAGIKFFPISKPIDGFNALPLAKPSPTIRSNKASNPDSQPVCTQGKGKIEVSRLNSPLLFMPMTVRIYTPPCYEQEQNRRYPVLYLLHGQGFTDEQWDRIGANEAADELISGDKIVPFIIVMPFDQSLTNPQDSTFGDAFIQTLLPWVDKTYRTLPDRAHRAIGGLSRGGAWAVHLGFSASETFGAIGVHSGFFFAGDKDKIYQWLQKTPLNSLPRIRLDIGARDDLRPYNNDLEKMLVSLQIPHEWYLYPGRHEESYWQKHLEEYLRWYTALW